MVELKIDAAALAAIVGIESVVRVVGEEYVGKAVVELGNYMLKVLDVVQHAVVPGLVIVNDLWKEVQNGRVKDF